VIMISETSGVPKEPELEEMSVLEPAAPVDSTSPRDIRGFAIPGIHENRTVCVEEVSIRACSCWSVEGLGNSPGCLTGTYRRGFCARTTK
jgi:hypothetical protein